jgi:hypothetical protein
MFAQSNTQEEWRKVMALKINALAANKTWVLVPPPPNNHVIGCK